MRRTCLAAGIAIGVLAVSLGTASGTTTYSTAIEPDYNDGPGPPVSFIGHLTSPKAKCLPGRTVKMLTHYPNGTTKVLDTDVTSKNGFWGLRGDFTGADQGHIKVTRRTIRIHHHRRICAADKITIFS